MFFMKTQIIKSMLRIPAGLIFFLIAMVPVTVIHRIVVVVKLPIGINNLLNRVYSIIEAVTDNTWFPTPTPTLLALKAAADDLNAEQVKVKNHISGSVPIRNAKRDTLKKLVYSLVNYIQGICDANPASAVGIAESALMYAKKVRGGAKQVFSAKRLTSGSVELIAAIKGHYHSHEWGISRDPSDPLSWIAVLLPSTLKSKTVVNNLKPGETVYFRHRIVTKDGPGDWDQVISLIIL